MGSSGGGGSPAIRVIERIIEPQTPDPESEKKKKNKTKSEASTGFENTRSTGGPGILTQPTLGRPTLTSNDRKASLGG